MSSPIRASVIAALCLAIGSSAWAAPLADHVVLVSVDGFRPDFYLDREWPAPTIQQMAEEGVKAERVRSVFPSVTYPAHTTVVTGALPARHGVYYNNPFEATGQTGRWYWDYEALETPTLWTALHGQGKKTAAISWPVTQNAPIDWLVPEVWSLEGDDRLKPMREGTRPRTLWAEIEEKATGILDAGSYSSAYIGRDLKTGAAAAFVLETYKPSLLAFHLIGTDHFMHQVGREGHIVRRAVATADSAINAVLEAAQRAGILDRTAFIVTGDHGFVDVHTSVAPNVWLAEAGLMETQEDRGEWRATFHTAGGAAFLHLKDPNDSAALGQVKKILRNLPPRIQKLFRVIDRDGLDAAGAAPDAALALASGLGVVFSARADGPVVGPADGGTHGFYPSDFPEIYTGFVGWGAGFKEGRTVHLMGLEDIAPIIAALLDFPFDAPDGTVLQGILD